MKRSLRVEIRPKNRMWSSLQRLAEERQVDIREDGSVYTSSTCVLRWGQSDSYVDLAPEMDAAFSLPVGKYVRPQWQLELTEISVDNGCFVVALTMEDGEDYPKVRAPSRIMAMDLGIANFAAISSNTGERGILFKGAVLLSACHAYDRYMQEKAAGNHPGDSEDREKALRRKRNDYFRDYELKVIKILSSWCKEKDIDTIVVGSLHNESEAEKQGVSPLPYDEFRGLLRDMCLRQGMNYVEQDELFTSRASFCDGDVIPDHGEKAHFHGVRNGRLFTTQDGTVVNADLNASANIGRRAFPELYTPQSCNLKLRPIIYRHPDLEPDTKT